LKESSSADRQLPLLQLHVHWNPSSLLWKGAGGVPEAAKVITLKGHRAHVQRRICQLEGLKTEGVVENLRKPPAAATPGFDS